MLSRNGFAAATALIALAWSSAAKAQTFVTTPMAGLTDMGQRVVVPAGTAVQVLDCRAVCTVAVSGMHLLIPPQFLSDRGGGRSTVSVARQAPAVSAVGPSATQRPSGGVKSPSGTDVIPFVPQ